MLTYSRDPESAPLTSTAPALMVDEQQLSGVLSEFARTMVTDFPIEAILDHLVERIVDLLPIGAAGVTLISAGADPRYVAASNSSALRYEQLQTELGEGPCLLAYHSGHAVDVPDLRLESRFPKFTPRALAAGLAAVFTFPLHHGDRRLGALDLYRDSPGPLIAESMSVAQTLADVVAAYLLNAQAREDLQGTSDRSHQASLHDALTGLPNRVLFLERLEHAFLRSRRSGLATAVYFVDLDLFKVVNDTHGHGVGDKLLVAVARRLTRLLRPADTLARLAGDEFAGLCEEIISPAHADAIGARISAALAEPFNLSGTEVRITASVGIAYADHDADDAERLVHDADMAMYQAKKKGGSRQQFYDHREQDLADRQADLQRDLHKAVVNDELHLAYQPMVETGSEQIAGFEALLRWTHPTRGPIPPITLVPLAEQCGLMTEIGHGVLRRALSDRNSWPGRGLDEQLGISVNVSAHELLAVDFTDVVQALLVAAGTPAHLLTLELTESAFVQDSDRAALVLRDLAKQGVKLALDDFGTGYSSLNYLKKYPMDIVKLDRSLVTEVGHDAASRAIVSAVVQLAHDLEMTVVAEGVETADQYRQVTELGCDQCQGYYPGRPMPAAAIVPLLRRRAPLPDQ